MKNAEQIFWELNEIAIINRWSDFFNENFIYLFSIDESDNSQKYYQYYVNLQKFTILNEKVEGLEHTNKMFKMIEYFAELILFYIPDIPKQEYPISISIIKKDNSTSIIYFHHLLPNNFLCKL